MDKNEVGQTVDDTKYLEKTSWTGGIDNNIWNQDRERAIFQNGTKWRTKQLAEMTTEICTEEDHPCFRGTEDFMCIGIILK